ncbi:MAG: hypothetical protein JW874_11690 [Spirochaetales bacterium]|nr:hypothetical protein [Spirochaetales bacterium]
MRAHDPYGSFWRTSVSPGKEWSGFSFEVTLDNADPLTTIESNAGDQIGRIWIDIVSLRRID